MRATNCLLHLVLIFCVLLLVSEALAPIAMPGCPEKCGNLTVPYPFGIGKGCYLNEFFQVSCNATSLSATLSKFQFVVDEFGKDFVRIRAPTVPFFYNKSTGQNLHLGPPQQGSLGGYYSFSQGDKNKFVAVGCEIVAYIVDGKTRQIVAGCPSFCEEPYITPWIPSSSCLGNLCCQVPMPRYYSNFSFWVHMMNSSWSSDQCGIAMIVDKTFTDFNRFNVSRWCNDSYLVPLVLDWAIGNMRCHEAKRSKNYACGKNTRCSNSPRGYGYQCTCMSGYEGNAYLPIGCQDVNECDREKYMCPMEAICKNTEGDYNCACPPGYRSESRNPSPYEPICVRDGRKKDTVMFVSLVVGLSSGVLFLIAISLWLYRQLRKGKKNEAKRKFFKRNGGLILQQQMASAKGTSFETKLFISEELEKATDNFNGSRVIGKGGLGTVYKGMLSNGSIVAVKKSNKIDGDQVSQFINEVLILSQVRHRHIVKLLGCCLETEVPLLVYEYISNGTLSCHLHDDPNATTITWENRLRIAAEVAGALAYLHSYASTAIFHRDIKSSNILLDENYRAVVSDFGLSRSVSIDKTHLTTRVGGTFGYLDPEYFRSGQLNDKSDVYAFGVVLAELLTGQKAISSARPDEGLAIHFRDSVKENRLFDIVEEMVANQGLEEEIVAVAKLAKRCLKLNARKRPCMKEVAAEFEQLRRIRERSVSNASFEENYSSVSERSYNFNADTVTEDEELR